MLEFASSNNHGKPNELELFGIAALHGAIIDTTNGVTQLLNAPLSCLSVHIPELKFRDEELKNATSPSDRAAVCIGEAVGSVLPLWLIGKGLSKIVGPGIGELKTAEFLGSRTASELAWSSFKTGSLTGLTYGLVFTPTEKLSDRWKNGLFDAMTFGVFNTMNVAGRQFLSNAELAGSMNRKMFFSRELPSSVAVGLASGGATGLVSSSLGSYLYFDRAPSHEELATSAAANAIFGGAFGALNAETMFRAKAARLTPEQIQKIQFASRSDGRNDGWVKIYENEFPQGERQLVSKLRQNFHPDSGSTVNAQGRPASDGARMTLHETRAPNGRLLAASINEVYPARPEVTGDRGFILGAWSFVDRSLQSAGIGRQHLPRVIDSLKQEYGGKGYLGRVIEIESTNGLPGNSQQARRERFFREQIGIKSIDKNEVPYEIPLFQPAKARELGVYVPQREIPQWLKSNGGSSNADGPYQSELMWSSFNNEPLSGSDARSIVNRIYRWGYWVRDDDLYMKDRLHAINEHAKDVAGSA